MKILLTGLLVGLATLAFATVADGDRALERGDYRTAIEEYRAAFEQRDTNIVALYKLARAQVYLAETLDGAEAEALYTEAAQYAQTAVELAPGDPEAHLELARALGRRAQFTGVMESLSLANEVKATLERTLELDPENGSAYHALALWNLEVPWVAGGRAKEVRPLFDRAISAEPDVIAHRVAYAGALLQLGDDEAAREQLTFAFSLPTRTYQDEQDIAEAEALMSGLE